MSNFDESTVNKIKRLEREVERLKVNSEKALPDGWIPVSSTWTYASATTITVPSGAASIYSVGDKFRLTANGVVLQGYIVTVADTLLTVVGNALTNHTFSAISYSKAATPLGFPGYFVYTPAWTASTTNPTLSNGTIYGGFNVNGTLCTIWVRLVIGVSTNTGSGNWAFSLPITASTASLMYMGVAHCRDTGVKSYIRTIYIEPETKSTTTQYWVEGGGTNTLTITPTSPFTWGNGDILMFTLSYLI